MFTRNAQQVLLALALSLLPALQSCSSGSSKSAKTSVKVAFTTPADKTTNHPLNAKITATFNQSMDTSSIGESSYTLANSEGKSVSGVVTYFGLSKTVVFTPGASLSANTTYVATLNNNVKSKTGKALAENYVWSVSTGTTVDTEKPTIISKFPTELAQAAPINRDLSVVFSETMDPSTIDSSTFKLAGPGGTSISGTVSYLGTTATFHPKSELARETSYTATLTTGVKDLAGNALVTDLVWTFTTGNISAQGPSPVNLGTAGSYVILAKSAVSTTGVTTSIVGNVALSPAAQSYITGFSEALDATNEFATAGVVTGKIYAADMTSPTPSKLTVAVADMETAYTDAAGRTTPDFTELGAGDVSGKTLEPGLYKWGTGLLMTSNVTLSGSENDVWIFQIAQNLTVENGVAITLAGGALAKNIFWQVAGEVSLGTTSSFKGIILSKTKIVLKTGAVLNGRTLAQTAVTLDANAVTQPD